MFPDDDLVLFSYFLCDACVDVLVVVMALPMLEVKWYHLRCYYDPDYIIQLYILIVIFTDKCPQTSSLHFVLSYQACMHRHEYITVIHSVYFNK